MSTKIIDFYDFQNLILQILENIPEEQQAPESRIDGWIRTAHRHIQDGEYDISVVKLAIKHMEDFDNGDFKISVGVFVALMQWYDVNLTLSAEMPEYDPNVEVFIDG